MFMLILQSSQATACETLLRYGGDHETILLVPRLGTSNTSYTYRPVLDGGQQMGSDGHLDSNHRSYCCPADGFSGLPARSPSCVPQKAALSTRRVLSRVTNSLALRAIWQDGGTSHIHSSADLRDHRASSPFLRVEGSGLNGQKNQPFAVK